MLTHLSLFSGIGGLDLAAEWAGFTTIGQCEWADYPAKVLEKHWPDVPRWRDIRTLTGGDFYERTGLRTVDIVSGGFPCQPFSVAGKQKGREDDRYLWPEMLRVITELAPRWVVGENVPGIINIAADGICADLERAGYEVGIFDFEAAAVGAPHRRERIAFVAHSVSRGRGENRNSGSMGAIRSERQYDQCEASQPSGGSTVADTKHNGFASGKISESLAQRGDGSKAGENKPGEPSGCRGGSAGNQLLADCDSQGLQRRQKAGKVFGEGKKPGNQQFDRCSDGFGWWAVEPDVGRVATRVPARVDRLKCLGNAVVPQQFYPIFKAIADIENDQNTH